MKYRGECELFAGWIQIFGRDTRRVRFKEHDVRGLIETHLAESFARFASGSLVQHARVASNPYASHGLPSEDSDFLGATLADSRAHGLASEAYATENVIAMR